MNGKPLYCCFSIPLRDYLIANGLRYEICALSPNTKKMFWVFMRDEKLDLLLSNWDSITK